MEMRRQTPMASADRETGARLLLAFGRGRSCRACARDDQGCGRDEDTLECGSHWSFQQPILDRAGVAWAEAGSSTTNAPASMPASSAPAATRARRRRDMSATTHPLQAENSRHHGEPDRLHPRHDNCGVRWLLDSRPMRARSRVWRMGFAKMATGTALSRSARNRRSASAGLHGRAMVCRRQPPALHRPEQAAPGRIFRKPRRRRLRLRRCPNRALPLR